jgi:ureidoglycolate lyase
MALPMPRTVDIPIEPLTEASFAPFGAVVGALAEPPAFRSGPMETWRAPFEVDGAMQMTLCRYRRQPLEFTRLERHLAVTQGFLPLGGVASIMVVAPKTDLADPEAAPPADAVRAFRLDGDKGVVLWRGVWHALTRFPVSAPHVDIVLLTGRDTQAEIERADYDPTRMRLTHLVDYTQRGIAFRVVGLS